MICQFLSRNRFFVPGIILIGLLLLVLIANAGKPAATVQNSSSEPAPQEGSTSVPVPAYKPVTQPQAVEVAAEPIPQQVIIQFVPESTNEERVEYVESIGGTVVDLIDLLDTVVVNMPEESTEGPLPELAAVVGSEPDYFVSALDDTSLPNDPRYTEQWALPAIRAPQAWAEMPQDAPTVRVAVIDSGVCAGHPDLVGRIEMGWDFVEDDETPQDEFGHGCAVAGVIAANMNDGVGIAGVAPNAQIIPLRVLNASGVGSYSDVAAAIVYAADFGVQVINLSLGGSNPSATLENAVNYAIDKGVIVVAAAGNNGTEGALYPAAYEPVIAVGSVDPNLEHSSFSNYGSQIDIWAPGRDILTTKRDGSYGLVSGTSFAAPYVAGAEIIYLALSQSLIIDGNIVSVNNQTSSNTPPPVVSTIVTLDITNTPPTSTVGWVDYIDRTYEYKVSYPKDWILVESSLDGWGSGAQLFSPNFDFKSYIDTLELSKETIKVEIHALGNPEQLLPSNFLTIQDQPFRYLGVDFHVTSSENITIAGYPAIARAWNQNSLTGTTYYIFVDKTVYAIQKRPSVSIYDSAFEDFLRKIEFPSQKVENAIYPVPQELIISDNISGQANTPPSLKFPWASGNSWYFTGGPHPFSGSTIRSGMDFAPPSSDKDILAAAAGKVTYLNWLDGAAGNTIKIDHGDGWESWYLHLSANSFNVRENSQVPQGGFIAIAGGSGTGGASIHIHIELRRYGQPQGWHDNTIDGWRISENCVGYLGSGCMASSYNGYIEKSGRQVIPEASPGSSQLVQSSNVPVYACFPLASGASFGINAENTCGGGILIPTPTAPPPTPPPGIVDGLKLISVSSPTVQKGETFPVSITYEVVSGQLREFERVW